MINENSINKDHSENDDKSKKFDSLIRAFNEKGIFPFSLENLSQNLSTKISSPSKKDYNKQKFEFSSLKKDFNTNNYNYAAYSGNKLPDFLYGLPFNQFIELSGQKDFFEYENNLKKELNLSGRKRIRQKLDNEFENLIFPKKNENEKFKNNEKICFEKNNINKKVKYPIVLTINDEFFDMLTNIYTNEGIEIGFKKVENFSQKQNNLNDNNLKNDNDIINEISCICLKSKCLNNYCSCHKNGKICNKNCRCLECKNTYNYINNKSNSSSELKKNKNICKCRNSNCSSCYCDCKKRGILCGEECLCINCKNKKSGKN